MNLMPRWHSQLKPQFIKLLYNDMDVVLEGMVPNISNILLKFSESGLLNPERPVSSEHPNFVLPKLFLLFQSQIFKVNETFWLFTSLLSNGLVSKYAKGR